MIKTTEDKYINVLTKNTYYFVNNDFEEKYEIYINSIKDRLLRLKNDISNKGLREKLFEDLLKEKNGRTAILALTGFSNESFKRILTVIRVISNDELNQELFLNRWNSYNHLIYLVKLLKDLNIIKNFEDKAINYLKNINDYESFNINGVLENTTFIRKIDKTKYNNVLKYCKNNFKYRKNDLKELSEAEFTDNFTKIINYLFSEIDIVVEEWTDEQIKQLIKLNNYFIKGLVNLFFKGSTIQTIINHLPSFEVKKLSIQKLSFEIPELIDSLIRYKEKGSYSGQKENNPEIVVEGILNRLEITFDKGDLKELLQNEYNQKRTMDFIIPNKDNPIIIIECSFLVTTSSGQGDKSKTEQNIDSLIKKHYPSASFIGFVDGIGWYVRKGDLERMVTAYEDVFTFHKDELERFKKLLIEKVINK